MGLCVVRCYRVLMRVMDVALKSKSIGDNYAMHSRDCNCIHVGMQCTPDDYTRNIQTESTSKYL